MVKSQERKPCSPPSKRARPSAAATKTSAARSSASPPARARMKTRIAGWNSRYRASRAQAALDRCQPSAHLAHELVVGLGLEAQGRHRGSGYRRPVRGVGTVVNVLTVLVGTAAGVVAGRRLPDRVRDTVLQGVGLATLAIGAQEAFKTRNIVFPLVALVVGGAVGEAVGLEDRVETLGEAVRRRFERPGPPVGADSTFVAGFVTASLVFC